MLTKWWWAILLGLLVAVWLIWWASSGYPLKGQICEIANPPQNCATHNIIAYSAWRLAKFVDDWSALITAIATAAITGFTFTLKRATDKLFEAGKSQSASTEKTARAAELSADVAQARLNPVLWPRITESKIGWPELVDGKRKIEGSPYIKLEFENFGGSIAASSLGNARPTNGWRYSHTFESSFQCEPASSQSGLVSGCGTVTLD